MVDLITVEHFFACDIRAGKIIKVEDFPKAKNPSYKLWIDFGELGIKQSSAQLTHLYTHSNLIGKQILAVINFSPKNIAGFKSEVLVLGLPSPNGVVLLTPDFPVVEGVRVY